VTSRERMRAVLEGRVPDQVPRGLYGPLIDIVNDYTRELFATHAGKDPLDCFRHDLRTLWLRDEAHRRNRPKAPDGEWYSQKTRRIETIADLEKIRLRELWAPTPYTAEALRPQVERLHDQGLPVLIYGRVTLFQFGWWLRGQTQFLMDIALGEPWLEPLLDIVADAAAADAAIFAAAGPELVGTGDDVGTQKGLFISPEHWRKYFNPRVKRIVDAAKRANPAVRIVFHSCGNVWDIIPDLIEAGVDVLNPIQPEAMDAAAVKREFGRDLVLWGGVSCQRTLAFGGPEDVREEVRQAIDVLGADGGYILSPAHMINAPTPWENIVAFFEAADEYGRYAPQQTIAHKEIQA